MVRIRSKSHKVLHSERIMKHVRKAGKIFKLINIKAGNFNFSKEVAFLFSSSKSILLLIVLNLKNNYLFPGKREKKQSIKLISHPEK